MLINAEKFGELKKWTAPDVVDRIKSKLNLSFEDAGQLFEDLKLFLFICSSNDGISYKKYRPSVAIDDAWHEFLLFTKKYREFCINILDVFVDHTPGFDEKSIQGDLLLSVVRGYLEKPSKFWFSSEADCVSCWGEPHPDDADCSNDYSNDALLMPTTSSFVKFGEVLNEIEIKQYFSSSTSIYSAIFCCQNNRLKR